jgi:hypothetical protein
MAIYPLAETADGRYRMYDLLHKHARARQARVHARSAPLISRTWLAALRSKRWISRLFQAAKRVSALDPLSWPILFSDPSTITATAAPS